MWEKIKTSENRTVLHIQTCSKAEHMRMKAQRKNLLMAPAGLAAI